MLLRYAPISDCMAGSRPYLQKIGKCMMLPVSVLPVAGILLGVGSTNFSWLRQIVSQIMAQSGGAIFSNLPLLFAVGVAIGLTDNDGVAALASTVGFVVFLATMGVLAKMRGIETTTAMGIPTIETGVFGGIIVGLIAASVFNRFYKVQLPSYLGFFAGKRSVPIITAFAVIVAAVILSFIWPPIGNGIQAFSNWAVHGQPAIAFTLYGIVVLFPRQANLSIPAQARPCAGKSRASSRAIRRPAT